MNYHVYGVMALSDRTEGAFADMMGQLYRIKPTTDSSDKLWVSRQNIKQVQDCSPAFAQMDVVNVMNIWTGSDTGEMNGDMISWIIRDAASDSGHFTEAKETQEYFRTIYREIRDGFKNGTLTERPGFQISRSMRNITLNELLGTIGFALESDLCFLRYPHCTIDLTKMFVDDPHDAKEENVLEWERVLNITLPRSDVQLDTLAVGELPREQNAIRKRYIRYASRIQNFILSIYQFFAVPVAVLSFIGFLLQLWLCVTCYLRKEEAENGKLVLINSNSLATV